MIEQKTTNKLKKQQLTNKSQNILLVHIVLIDNKRAHEDIFLITSQTSN